jgi:hypothetical protein
MFTKTTSGFAIYFFAALPFLLIADASADNMGTLALVERATTDTVIDTGAPGDSSGDLLTYANEIFDKDNAAKVGGDNGWCIRVVAGKSWECTFTLILADGQITAEGPFYDASDSAWAITGGTGRYVGISGEMKLHARNDQGSEYDFVYSYDLK